MFVKGSMYRHRNMIDLDVYVASNPDDYGAELFMCVKYWNRHSKVFQPDLHTTDNVLVKKSDLDSWVLIS